MLAYAIVSHIYELVDPHTQGTIAACPIFCTIVVGSSPMLIRSACAPQPQRQEACRGASIDTFTGVCHTSA
eukprot:1190963-Prorocentrum_minimum.AAC.3